MNLFVRTHSPMFRLVVAAVLLMSLMVSFAPLAAHAQAAAPATTQAPQTGGSSCEGWSKAYNPICWLRSFSVAGSMVVIYATGWILGLAGTLLNASLEITVGSTPGTGFQDQIYSRIQGGVEAVWTVFRDIANILIIGMFTFIALSMILGIDRYNARQMVARILLIAVLINFSLLFTRIIISSSNFVAAQFYKAAQFGVEPATGLAPTFGGYSTGISGKFAQLLGVTSFSETREALWTAELGSLDPGIMTLIFGGLTGIIMIATALVFYYIAFLLIARALLFIMLLITSSLAFASHLIPGGAIGGYGWSTWWSSLLKNAVFAPLLLMLLWATIQIASGVKLITGNGSLGGLLADSTNVGNVNALISYLLILGMLYASVKIASKFAHDIEGFNWATMAAGIPLALGSRLGGALTRAGIGGIASRVAKNYDKQMDAAKAMHQLALNDIPSGISKEERARLRAPLDLQLNNELRRLDRLKGVANYVADRKFNPAGTKLGKQFLKSAGVPDWAAGDAKSVKSNTKYAKEVAEEAAKHAAEVAKPSSSQEKAAIESVTKGLKEQQEILKRGVQLTERSIQQQEANHVELRRHQEEQAQARGRQIDIERDQTRSAQDREALMRQEQEKINRAQSNISRIQRDIQKKSGILEQKAALARNFEEMAKATKQAKQDVSDTMKSVGAAYAAESANRRWTNTIPWALGKSPENDLIAQKARAEFEKKKKEDKEDGGLKRLFQKWTKEQGSSGGGGSPPSAPAPSAEPHH